MRKFLFIFILLFLGFAFSQPDEKSADDSKSGTVMDNIKTDIQLFKDNKDLQEILTGVMEEAQNWADQFLLIIGQYTGEKNLSPEDKAEKPVLKPLRSKPFLFIT